MLDIGMKTLTVMGMLFFLYGVLTLITGRTRRDRIAGAVFIVWGIVNVIPPDAFDAHLPCRTGGTPVGRHVDGT